MPGIYFARIMNYRSGVTNQIFSLINSIIIARSRKNYIVVVGQLLRDFVDMNSGIDLCKVIDLEKTNEYLKKYNITLICKSQFDYKLNAIFYGESNHIIDITDQSPDIILPGTLNSISGDPSPNTEKELFINYSINGIEYSDFYKEMHEHSIWVKGTYKEEYEFRFVNKLNESMYQDIMKHIVYHTKIDNHLFLPVITNKNINVIHLRIEDDGIEHWSRQNNMKQEVFKQILEEKYINVIREHINPNYKTIIVGNKYNKVVDFLSNNHYDYIYYDMNINGREIHAIYDLIQASQCNETFIGNFNHTNMNGSSFSYYISVVSNPKKIISLDIDNISSKPIIYSL